MSARSRHPVLYEINTRVWLRQLSQRYRRPVSLGTVPEEVIAEWSGLGFTYIWLMGVWKTGPLAARQALACESLKGEFDRILPGWAPSDVAASPYAIADYSLSPTLGGTEDLAVFRGRLHAQGLRLILDFVPNHVGLDHAWAMEKPELFVWSDAPAPGYWEAVTSKGVRWLAHGRDPHFAPWVDTLQLDYRNQATREAMARELARVASVCDGVRCDMAMLVLNEVFARTWPQAPLPEVIAHGEFWEEAISGIQSRTPEFLFLAEVYWDLERTLRDLGFDYTYDKVLYDRLMHREGGGVVAHLCGLAAHDAGSGLTRGAHFLENHDEARVAGRLSLAEHRVALWLILSLPGMRFLHEGQLEGARTRLPVQFLAQPAEPNPEIAGLYRQALGLLRRTNVGQGNWRLLTNRDAAGLLIIQWGGEAGDWQVTLVALNLTPAPARCEVDLCAGLRERHWTFEQLLGASTQVGPDTGNARWRVSLEPWEVSVWVGRTGSLSG